MLALFHVIIAVMATEMTTVAAIATAIAKHLEYDSFAGRHSAASLFVVSVRPRQLAHFATALAALVLIFNLVTIMVAVVVTN